MYIELELGLGLGVGTVGGYLSLTVQDEGLYRRPLYDDSYFDVGQDNATAVTSVNKSDLDVVSVIVTLYKVSGSDTNATIVFSGGKSQYEEPGPTRNFDLFCTGATITNTDTDETTVELVIPAGSLSNTITMHIINNLVSEEDRVITISAAGYGASKTLTIVSDTG